MRVLRSTLAVALLAGLFGASAPLDAQTGSVTGVVRSADGQTLAGVQLSVVGTNIGTLSNSEGRYLIPGVPVGAQEIRAVNLGYEQQTRTVQVTEGAPAVADFTLGTSAIALEALIVNAATGREQRARELGSNVAQIDFSDINPAPITNFADAIGGRTSGLVLQDVNGSTGTSQRIRIRGSNSLSLSNEPLIYVDGVQISQSEFGIGVGGQETSRLNDINPQDIANIEVVKGPAASALYGTAAANGVILITTKRGVVGDAQWQFFAETGKIDDTTDYPTNFAALQIDDPSADIFTASGGFNGNAVTLCPTFLAATGACTQDRVVDFNTLEDSRTSPLQTGFRNRAGATVRGGNEQIRYFVSGSWEKEQGVIIFNETDQVKLRANMDAKLDDLTDLSFSIGYTDNTLALNSNDNSAFSPLINGLLGFPNLRTDADGEITRANYGFSLTPETLSQLPTNQTVDRLTMSSRINFRPLTWLTLNGTAGLDFVAQHDFETLQPGTGFGIFGSPLVEGFRDSNRTETRVYTARSSAIGSFELSPEVTSNTTVGFAYDQSTTRRTECFGADIVPGTSSCGTVSSQFDIDEDFFEIRTVGAFLQQEFAWRDLVFIAGSVRGDDNSAFGSDLGFVYYPSVSASWVIGEEAWFPQTDWVTNLRLRGAWGESGLRPGFRDAVTLFAPVSVATDAGDAPGVVLSSTGNTALEPERSSEIEFGFDVGLLRDRVAVDFTYFDKRSNDALINRPLPGSLGLTTNVFENLGEIKNAGTELTVNVDVFQSDLFGLNVGFTNSTLDNKVEELGEGIDPIIFNRGLQRHEEGFAAGGFWQRPFTFEDADGDGKLAIGDITVADEAEFIGPSVPEWNRTAFADLRISNWITVSTLFEGRGGFFRGNDTESFRCLNANAVFRYGCSAAANPDASLEDQARSLADTFFGTAYGYIEEADFWRWRELSVAFDMPTYVTSRVQQLDGLRLTVAGRNLAVFTDYSGLDPETNETGGSSNFNQSEFNTQPPVRYLMLRLDYTF